MKTTLRAAAAALSLACGGIAQVPDLYDIDAYRTIHLQFHQPNYWSQLEANYVSEVEIPADMTVDGITYPSVGVRFRGNTSYLWLPPGSEKKSFNIRTDAFLPGQDIYGIDHLNLNNGFHDPTFLREFLTYWVCRRHGPAPKCNFVKLTINGQFWGVYINVQQPNKDWAKDWFRSNDGNRYRGFPTSGSFANGRCALTWLGSTVGAYLSAYQAKQGDGTDLMQLCNVLNNTPAAQLQAQLPAWLNVDQFYRYASVMNILTQEDSYIGSGKDHFLYRDEAHGDFHMFPFDVNEALAGSTTLNPWWNTTSTIKPAFSKTLVFPDWRERYDAHYRNILEDSASWAALGPMITRFHAMIAADVQADTKKIYTTAQFFQNLTQSVTVLENRRFVTIPGLQPLIQGREAYLRSLPDFNRPRVSLANLRHDPALPAAQQTVCVNVDASANATLVQLWFRSVGPFQRVPMFDDGLHCDGAAGDGTYGASIPGQAPGAIVEYYVLAQTAAADMSFLPRNADFQAASFRIDWPRGTSPIRINEFVAQNQTGIVDEAGQHEDWLELYNSATVAVDASGMWLTDDLSQTKYQIPAGNVIPAGGTLHVWCDEDGTQGPRHANFKLSASGEEIGLFAADGVTLVDWIVFGRQVVDVSTGRLEDGQPTWVSFPTPSPYARNEIPFCGVRAFTALDANAHRLSMTLVGAPRIGTSPTLQVAGGPVAGSFALGMSTGAAYLPLGFTPSVLLLDLVGFAGPLDLPLDASGSYAQPVAIPNLTSAIGASVFLQGFTFDALGVTGSNALEAKFCP